VSTVGCRRADVSSRGTYHCEWTSAVYSSARWADSDEDVVNWFGRTIAVRFLEEGQSLPFAQSDVPLDQLPDTFAVHTDLDIAGAKYVVLRAVPESKADFSRTKRLDVTVRKLETVRPSQLLFSLPSVCGAALPESLDARPSGEIVTLHEDDWRQCEFVSVLHHRMIAEELASVRRIHEVEAVAVGWRRIHVRRKIETPIPTGIEWARVAAQLGEWKSLGGVAFGDEVLVGVTAARLPDGVVVWAVAGAAGLSAICVENVRAATGPSAAALIRVADELSLALVDWCACRAYVPGAALLEGSVGNPWD
jgi:hypothetical protein